MYIPKHFALDDADAVAGLIADHSLGTLIMAVDGAPEAAHVPFVFDREAGDRGTLRAHVARTNPLWRVMDGHALALVVFVGPDAYVSPDWYETEHQVPTWNYVAVHAYGRPRVINDAGLVRLLDALSAASEARLLPKRPWTTGTLADTVFAKMRRAIVGFEIPIERLEAKGKLSQNKRPADRERVALELRRLGGPHREAVAAWIERESGGPPGR